MKRLAALCWSWAVMLGGQPGGTAKRSAADAVRIGLCSGATRIRRQLLLKLTDGGLHPNKEQLAGLHHHARPAGLLSGLPLTNRTSSIETTFSADAPLRA